MKYQHHLLLGGLVALAGCDRLALKERRGTHVVVALIDPSASTNAKSRCAEALAPIRSTVEAPRVRRVDVLVLATGNAATGEPQLLVPWTSYAPGGDLFATPEDAARQREEFLRRVLATCERELSVTDASPVYEGINRALVSIKARCHELASTRTPCERRQLVVMSDLRSTYGTFGLYLRAKVSGKNNKVPARPAALELGEVELSMCGVSNTTGGDHLITDDVLAVWREVLGDEVTIAPTCAVDQLAQELAP